MEARDRHSCICGILYIKLNWIDAIKLITNLESLVEGHHLYSGMSNYAPFLSDLIFYSYEAKLIPDLLKITKTKLVRSFSFTFRYIDDESLLRTFW
jgi:hypothetical protein